MAAYSVPATGDPGLQPERTALAWSRTALALAVNALLSMRAGFVTGQPVLVAVGALLFAASGAAVAIGTVRRRQLVGNRLVITPPRGALVGVAAATMLAAIGGIASIFAEGAA
ncbi:uncharacterized membrane protein YidH (DUF202 family) [Agromyces hippuratus]|uniref:Uncharacterized membrane protein YidH (DUF202 family) n=1 Tax=Agromyces hippuratus TaxID=286438 RepID=A0A852X2B8_9MICO|nr:DUF202 domain-containing protein [Agromyces hippuratus]NYG22720.1 uncharacterized membrane protein YidH (DUF202 family) [Agromyces hippuratus]